MLGNLGENLTNTMKKLVGMSVIDKKTIKEVVKDIQRALIQSDVNIQLVLDLSKKIETRALEEEPPKGITPREHVITIIYEEMVNLLGSEAAGLDINDRPYKKCADIYRKKDSILLLFVQTHGDLLLMNN